MIKLVALCLSTLMVSGNAPDLYTVACETSKGPFDISVNRSWAPKGADRFYELVLDHFYDDAPFFRMVEGFVVQFGLNSDPKVTSKWSEKTIQDDPVTESNKVGYLSFAMRGPNTRTTQLFINLVHNKGLDDMGFAPFAVVDEVGMKLIKSLDFEYAQQPDQGLLTNQGGKYWKPEFPNMDYLVKCVVKAT